MSVQPLSPQRFRRLQELFEHAVERSGADRDAFIAQETGADSQLHDELVSLLAAHDRDDTGLSSPIRIAFDPEDEASRWIGVRVGAWQVKRRIGYGGMGTVCEAVRADDQYRKRVAVKFLHRFAAGPDAVRRFKAERQMLANLSHPNVAALIDGGVTDDGQPYLVMEYIDGAPITEWCTERKLTLRDRVKLFLQVCAAVESAHRNLIVHRDLKPANILVTQEGHVKLLDFGIARLLSSAEDTDAPPQTMVAQRSFTPDYAAPEQVRGTTVATSADVYALGVVLYELIAGKRPYDLQSRSFSDIERMVCETPAPPANVQVDLDAVLAMALRKEPERRYGNVGLLAADLRNFLDGKPVTARPDGLGYRTRKFIGRHRVASIAAGIAAVGIVGATGVALWQASEARSAAEDTRLINSFLLEVLSMSDPFDAGSELTLSQALDQAAQRIDERFVDRRDLTAEIRFGIGYSLVSRYKLDEAEQQLTKALEESTAEFGPDDIRTLRVMEGIAGLRQEQDREDEARVLFENVLAKMEATGKRDNQLYIQVLGNLGNLHLTEERYADADRYLQNASAADQAMGGELTLDRANLHSNLAHSAHGLQDYARAEEFYRLAQQEYEKLFPNGNPDLAILLNNRALLAEERGDKSAAMTLHRQSLAVRRRVFGAEHPMIVVALTNVARMSLVQTDLPSALSHATEAAVMADRVYPAANSRHAGAHGVLADAKLTAGDFVGAVESWRLARALLDKVTDAPPSAIRELDRVKAALCTQVRPAPTFCRISNVKP
jgi:serine/threonine-protein kinase